VKVFVFLFPSLSPLSLSSLSLSLSLSLCARVRVYEMGVEVDVCVGNIGIIYQERNKNIKLYHRKNARSQLYSNLLKIKVHGKKTTLMRHSFLL